MKFWATIVCGFALAFIGNLSGQEKIRISGIYPHLAHTNNEKEVGIGAVVPWAGSLWTNTYGPHLPYGSSDKLRQIDKNWNVVERKESVGGTPANRMIHPETQQLLIGHHVIDKNGNVRTIDPKNKMPGRITANARHLSDPENKCYYLTMENGVYEVDLRTLDVKTIIPDPINIAKTHLPGYHGKGAYTGSGRVVVSNNGEPSQTSPSGCLASWDGKDWTIVARNQFVEVTGPGGLRGNSAEDDRVWAVGWDDLSVRLYLLQDGEWSKFRLPKGSYTHDANHGWNTEWPRIRKIKSDLTLMHMHGMFFRFPQSFSKSNYGGLTPISTYLKMPVDYAWFNDQLVIAKDDASKFDNDFVKQSQSNLWIGNVEDLNRWGPRSGFGGVWNDDCFDAGNISEPFLISGFKHINLHLHHKGAFRCRVDIQLDREGTGNWEYLETIEIDKVSGYTQWVATDLDAQWIRLVARDAADRLTAYFHLTSPFNAKPEDDLFASLGNASKTAGLGATLQLPKGRDMKLNVFGASAHYQVDGQLRVSTVPDNESTSSLRRSVAIKTDERLGSDRASAYVNYKNPNGRSVKLRLPKGSTAFDSSIHKIRHIRELVTERTMMNLHGTFYELPRPRPGSYINFWQMKPISSHNRQIHDMCSWRGMLVLSGAKSKINALNHIDVGATGLWLGEVDDLWKFGKPVGQGGPWLETTVKKNRPSDPYLMLGYDKKLLSISHDAKQTVEFDIEIDFLGKGNFVPYATVSVMPGETHTHQFPRGFAAHWIRFVARSNTRATAQLLYQ